MVNKNLEKYENFIKACTMAGLGVRLIKQVLFEHKRVKVKAHQLSNFINNNRVNWAHSMLICHKDTQIIIETHLLKTIRRKPTSRSSIPANTFADVLCITSRHPTVKSAHPAINNFLRKKQLPNVSYSALCRFINKQKGV